MPYCESNAVKSMSSLQLWRTAFPDDEFIKALADAEKTGTPPNVWIEPKKKLNVPESFRQRVIADALVAGQPIPPGNYLFEKISCNPYSSKNRIQLNNKIPPGTELVAGN